MDKILNSVDSIKEIFDITDNIADFLKCNFGKPALFVNYLLDKSKIQNRP
jgi:hypothetical protein